MKFLRCLLAGVMAITVVGCDKFAAEEKIERAPVIRGLKTIEVTEIEPTEYRHYPSVLQPASISTLSFEIGGKLEELTLNVGQSVKQGDVIASISPVSLEAQASSAIAAVERARVAAQNSANMLARQESLLAKGAGTQVMVDDARTNAVAQEQALVQAQQQLSVAQENLGKTTLVVPFDGIINSVDAESFQTVGAGTPIASLYKADGFEVNFSVNYEAVSEMVVGKAAIVRMADNPSIELKGAVSELGSRADSVSSFPVVVTLNETHPAIKAGMAVEVSLGFDVPEGGGYKIPLSASINEGKSDLRKGTDPTGKMSVYVYDASSRSVKQREVEVGGVHENSLLVVAGLAPGERVAIAGVPFLREGMEVKLLDAQSNPIEDNETALIKTSSVTVETSVVTATSTSSTTQN